MELSDDHSIDQRPFCPIPHLEERADVVFREGLNAEGKRRGLAFGWEARICTPEAERRTSYQDNEDSRSHDTPYDAFRDTANDHSPTAAEIRSELRDANRSYESTPRCDGAEGVMGQWDGAGRWGASGR